MDKLNRNIINKLRSLLYKLYVLNVTYLNFCFTEKLLIRKKFNINLTQLIAHKTNYNLVCILNLENVFLFF